MFWKHFKEFWTFGWIHPDNFWLPTDLTVAVGTGIDLNFDSMNKKGLFVAKFSKKLFYVRFSLWLFALILVFIKYIIEGPCLFINIKRWHSSCIELFVKQLLPNDWTCVSPVGFRPPLNSGREKRMPKPVTRIEIFFCKKRICSSSRSCWCRLLQS